MTHTPDLDDAFGPDHTTWQDRAGIAEDNLSAALMQRDQATAEVERLTRELKLANAKERTAGRHAAQSDKDVADYDERVARHAAEVARLRSVQATLRLEKLEAVAERDKALSGLAQEKRDHDDTTRERDQNEAWADKLADAISKATGQPIGEHSSENNPWEEARIAVEDLGSLVQLRTALTATRQMANDATGALRTQILAALGQDDDGRTSLSEYVAALSAERDAALDVVAKAQAWVGGRDPVMSGMEYHRRCKALEAAVERYEHGTTQPAGGGAQ